MECKQVSERLEDYFSDSMDEASRVDMRAHWKECPSCRDEADGLHEIWESLGLVSAPSPHPDSKSRFELMLAAYEQGLASTGSSSRFQGIGDWLTGTVWPRQPLAHAVWLVLFLVTGLVVGSQFGSRQTGAGLAVLEDEIRSLNRLVALSMLEQRSASQRLRGVTWTSQIDEPDADVVRSLLKTLDSDSSINVRLAVVEVLGQFGNDPVVREHVLESLPRQASPLVQVSLIDLLVEIREPRSLPLFEQLSGSETVHEAVRDRALWGLEEIS